MIINQLFFLSLVLVVLIVNIPLQDNTSNKKIKDSEIIFFIH